MPYILQVVLDGIINLNQVGYIKCRFIGENVKTIPDIIDYTEFFNISGLIFKRRLIVYDGLS